MIEESRRNYLVSLAIDYLRTGKPPTEELTPEERKSVETNYEYFKKVRDMVGEKEFSEITIDVGYDM